MHFGPGRQRSKAGLSRAHRVDGANRGDPGLVEACSPRRRHHAARTCTHATHTHAHSTRHGCTSLSEAVAHNKQAYLLQAGGHHTTQLASPLGPPSASCYFHFPPARLPQLHAPPAVGRMPSCCSADFCACRKSVRVSSRVSKLCCWIMSLFMAAVRCQRNARRSIGRRARWRKPQTKCSSLVGSETR